ncbi:hypothetical protein GCK72_019194 [Caenorhabditis remanei]|uniref:Serpentine receptor class gamma n=1 Tax=Caenorhabditis remanei TaxID=31234 RepID=E3LL78_CAERE|nr:hypothetical protein GCK72_019194 [Caenorhabditis remanei]EFO99923.1 hypothetical protein CRE_18858 [Caenorhabditis remanei]KAF1752639.1 hypothetical protein GCK72_019194 [Caenorhabditis remanei]
MSDSITITSMEIVSLDVWTIGLTYFQAFYGIPSVFLMLFFFFFFAFGKRYIGPFYRIVQLDLLVNILCYLNTWLTMRLEKIPIGIPFLKVLEHYLPGLQTFSRFLANYFMHFQFLTAAFMSVHRIIMMKKRNTTKLFWRKMLAGFTFFAVIYSFLPNLVLYHGFITKIELVGGTLSRTKNDALFKKGANITAVFAFFYFLILAFLGSYSVFTVSKLKKMNAVVSITKTLTKVAYTYCFLYVGILLWTVFTAIDSYVDWFPKIIKENNTVILGFFSDLMTLSLPYLLLRLDGNVKRDFFNKSNEIKKVIVIDIS